MEDMGVVVHVVEDVVGTALEGKMCGMRNKVVEEVVVAVNASDH